MNRISVIDSHTGGEPTRVVIAGGPDLGSGPMAERLTILRERHDEFRSAVVNEPRGSDVLVGALLCEPSDSSCSVGAIFFNNVGYLGMCGHGTIGLATTLAHLGRIGEGNFRIETPVGVVDATWHGEAGASFINVPSYRHTRDVQVDVRGFGVVTGDVAWGGNWFFLAKSQAGLALTDVEQLTDFAWRIRQAVNAGGYPEVDHIELFAGPQCGGHSRNFVLCPGKAYDRSPCGTGTSAKLACLAADGALAEGEEWVQESITGSIFRGSFRWFDRARGTIAPTIAGQAFVTGEATLLLNPHDPFCCGIPALP
jgi:proline racemase